MRMHHFFIHNAIKSSVSLLCYTQFFQHIKKVIYFCNIVELLSRKHLIEYFSICVNVYSCILLSSLYISKWQHGSVKCHKALFHSYLYHSSLCSVSHSNIYTVTSAKFLRVLGLRPQGGTLGLCPSLLTSLEAL